MESRVCGSLLPRDQFKQIYWILRNENAWYRSFVEKSKNINFEFLKCDPQDWKFWKFQNENEWYLKFPGKSYVKSGNLNRWFFFFFNENRWEHNEMERKLQERMWFSSFLETSEWRDYFCKIDRALWVFHYQNTLRRSLMWLNHWCGLELHLDGKMNVTQ